MSRSARGRLIDMQPYTYLMIGAVGILDHPFPQTVLVAIAPRDDRTTMPTILEVLKYRVAIYTVNLQQVCSSKVRLT